MLALRDKENLVHSHQTTAAAKPLNQSLRQLQPKTPGTRAPKTPFKLPLNDENNATAFGKKTVKGNGGGGLQSAKDAFVTPLGPRNRAPLGMKTTNAKATGFQTPGLQPDNLKTQKSNRKGSSLKKAKKIEPLIRPSEPQTLSKQEEDDVRDVEYAPPKPRELPDDPEEIPYDTTFPQFKGRNMMRGWEKVYLHGEVGEDGLTDREREFQQSSIAYDKMVDEMIHKQLEDLDFCDDFDLQSREEEPVQAKEEKKAPAKTVPTIKARNAASALSHTRSSSMHRAENPKPTVSTRSKTPTSLLMPKRRTPTPTNSSIAAASSRTTLGYSKGRSVSSTLQTKANPPKAKKTSKSIVDPAKYMELYGAPPVGSEMWMRCKSAGLVVDPEENVDANDAILSVLEEDEESRHFQLTL